MTGRLTVEGLHVRYGRVEALDGVDLNLEPGRILTVLGRNGAGKSSLLGAIAGRVRPSKGRVTWDGTDITRVPADRRARSGIALVPEGRRIFTGVTVAENLDLGGFSRSPEDRRRTLDEVLALFPVLGQRMEARGGALSGGQQQMLAIGRALMGAPRLLLLDEPSLGLAPKAVDDVYAVLRRLRDTGIAMLLVEQQVKRALHLADAAMVLSLGEVTIQGSPAILRTDPRLVEAYFGSARR